MPKFGNSENENEDNILIPSKKELECDYISRFAISDGATESSFSKEWSDLLVCAYKDKLFDKEHLIETINSVSESWQTYINTKELPWYAQQKAEMGAFATFLGLTIYRDKYNFDVMAIGDCSLFQIRNNKSIFSFPISSSKDFNNSPNLLATNLKYQPDLKKVVRYDIGNLLSKDIIVIATDALAAWIFKEIEVNNKPWNLLNSILSNKNYYANFNKWLKKRRTEREIKNDDVTLIIINFE